MIKLRTWQAERLSDTYEDFLTSPRYGPACEFFLSDIYAPREFFRRNRDIEYLYNVMSRFIPDIFLTLIHDAVDLFDLTNALDQKLLDVLVEDLGVDGDITPQLYAQAYRICDNYDDRVRQIDLLIAIGGKVDLTTHIPLVGTTLKLARRPAQRAGWHEIHNFLNRGFKAFKHMGGAKKFLQTIQEREMRILDKIYASHPNPFS